MIPLTEANTGLSHRRMQTLCKAGRVYGAVLVPGYPPRWYVPADWKIAPTARQRRPRRY